MYLIQQLHEEAFFYISMELDAYIDEIEKKEPKEIEENKQHFIEYLTYIKDMLEDHEKHVKEYAEFFEVKTNIWNIKALNYCVESVTNTLEKLRKNVDAEAQEAILEMLYSTSGEWEEKYRDTFGDWLSYLSDQGVLHYSKRLSIYSEDSDFDELDAAKGCFLEMFANVIYAERLFYKIERFKKKSSAHSLRNSIFNNRQRTSKEVPIIPMDKYNGRSIIAAAASAVEISTANADPKELSDTKNISKVTGWKMFGQQHGNWEKVTRGNIQKPRTGTEPILINYQHHPSSGNMANLKTSGVQEYGTGFSGNKAPNILELFNQLTTEDQNQERRLAELLLAYKRGSSHALEEAELEKNGFKLPKKSIERNQLITRLNKIAFLVCFQEVWRRKNQGYKKEKGEIKKVLGLPFGFAVSIALRLIADGNLRMRDVFDKDAEFGVFTGKEAMSKNLLKTIKKFNELFVKFVMVYGDLEDGLSKICYEVAEPQIVYTPEYIHQLLKKEDQRKDENESDGEDYGLLHGEIEELDEIKAAISSLNISPLKT